MAQAQNFLHSLHKVKGHGTSHWRSKATYVVYWPFTHQFRRKVLVIIALFEFVQIGRKILVRILMILEIMFSNNYYLVRFCIYFVGISNIFRFCVLSGLKMVDNTR